MKNFIIILIFCSISFYTQAQNNNQLILEGLKQVENGDLVKAIHLFTKVLEDDSNFVEGYFQRGLAKFKINDFRGAIKDLEKVINSKIENKEYIYMSNYLIGLSNFNINSNHKAITYFDKALSIKPNIGEVYLNRAKAEINLGKIEYGCNDLSRAIELGIVEAKELIKKYCIKTIIYDDSVKWIKYGENIYVNAYYDQNIVKENEFYKVITKMIIKEENYEEAKINILQELNNEKFENWKYVIFTYSVDIIENKLRLDEGEWYDRKNKLIERIDFEKTYKYYPEQEWQYPNRGKLNETLIKVIKTQVFSN